ncbi:bZIP transcription factor [Paraphaeosphaeria sporulosa]
MELETRNINGHQWPQHALFRSNGDNAQKSPAIWFACSNDHDLDILHPLSTTAFERYGQITPPEANLPADPCHGTAREASIPDAQLQNETLWPGDQEMQHVGNYQPPLSNSEEKPHFQQKPALKRKKMAEQKSTGQTTVFQMPEYEINSAANLQPRNRKRGRPRSQLPTVETSTSSGYLLQIASARQSYLEKNRVAANKCRERKKEDTNKLEARFHMYSDENQALKEKIAVLREEVIQLKNEVLSHAECGFWAVDEYIARCAGNLLGVSAPTGMYESQKQYRPGSSSWCTPTLAQMERESGTTNSFPSQGTSDSCSHDDLEVLDLLGHLKEDEEQDT